MSCATPIAPLGCTPPTPFRGKALNSTGGGGSGTPYAPLTVAARAAPDALWLTLGPTHREGHETDFANLTELGWVPKYRDEDMLIAAYSEYRAKKNQPSGAAAHVPAE